MKWTLIDSVTKFQGFFRLLQNQYQIERFSGEPLTLTRELFERGHSVGVLPYDPITDCVVLVQQFRPGATGFCDSPWLIELIAGMLEEGEYAPDVACREAREEAGCELQNLKQIAHYLASPGGSTESSIIYVATCKSTDAAEYAGLANEGEDIKVHIMPRSAFLQRLSNGEIVDALTLIAAQWFQHHFDAWKDSGFS